MGNAAVELLRCLQGIVCSPLWQNVVSDWSLKPCEAQRCPLMKALETGPVPLLAHSLHRLLRPAVDRGSQGRRLGLWSMQSRC